MQKWLTLLISFILIFSTFVIIPTVKAPSTFPIVVTSDATGVGETNAILHGRLMDDGGELCTVWFQYGLTVDNWTVTKEEGLKSGDLFFFDATGLESGKLYHYQACAGNSFGKVTGEDKTFLTTSNIKEEPYTYWQADENGGFSHWEVNKTFYRNWLNNTITWKVEQSIDNNIWVDYKKFEVKKDWDEKTLSEKHTVIVSSDKDAYYRILTNTVSSSDLVSYEDCSIKAIGEKSNDFRLTYKISDDKDYILMYNWDDYLNSSIASTSTFNKQIKSDILSKQLFEWSVVSNIKIKSGDSFILDPTYGLIGDAVTSTYEYDAQEGRYPDMIRLGTSEYYAIVSTGDSGTELDGYIRTIKVWNDNGTIKTALIDSLEYDTTDGRYPSIVNVGTDMYAILYGDTGTYFFVVTVSIDDADGLIAAAVTETLQLTYSPDLVYISHPRIIYVTGNVYAVIYEQSSNYIYMQTLNITSAGDIGAAVADSQRLEATAKASLPGNLCLVDSNTVAVVYDSGAVDGNDGYMTTWNISSTGDITNTYADFWEFDTSKGGTPYIAKVSGTTYMIAYEDTNADLYVKTCTIADTGMITKSWLDTQAINITNGDYPTFFNVSTNGTNQWIKGITFSGEGSDGYVSTFDVTSAGIINSVIDTLEVTAADTINWYQPACWVSGNYYLLITEDGVFDGWAKTFTIETYVYNNTAPLITANSQNPSNASTAVGLSLSGNYSHFNISVTDIDDATDNMNITWSTNESGAWLTMGTNASVSDGTYWCTNVSWVDSYSTKYWWNVSVNDGMGGFDNETYNFTTNAIPTITGEIPLNNSIDISLNPVCNVTVNDVDPNTLDVTFASNYSNGVDWVNYQTNSSVATGSNISWVFSGANTYNITHWWRVYCNDSTVNISETYYFTTKANAIPTITDENPLNQSIGVGLSLSDNYSHFNITVSDIDDATQDMNITWSTNESGTWTIMDTNTSVNNGTYYCTNISWVDSYSTIYWWNVSVNDGAGGFNNKTYSFTTKANTPPTITGEIPLNNSINISLNPICNVTVNDVDADVMTCDWYSRNNGFTNLATQDDGAYYEISGSDNGTYIFTASGNVNAYTFNGTDFVLKDSNSDVAGDCDGVWYDGTYLYAACSGDGLLAYSFDGSTLTLLDIIDDGGYYYSVYSDGTYIYATGWANGIYAYSFDGDEFTLIDAQDDGDGYWHVWGDGTYIYTSCWSAGIRAYSFNGVTFTLLDTQIDGNHWATWGDGTYIYSAVYGSGIMAYTFNGTNFTLKDTQDDGGNYYDIWGDGTYLYAASNGVGVHIYTFNGTNFILENTNTTTTTQDDVFCSNGHIYAGSNILYAFDYNDWVHQQTNNSVASGSNISWVFSGANTGDTAYWWRVYSNDGSVNISETFRFTTKANAIPTITDENPLNNSINISLNPICNVTVNDVDPNTLDVTFASNYSNGVDWVNYQTNSSVATGSNISWVFSDASTGGTAYWWRVYCDDIMINISATYSFETASNFTNGDGTEGNPFQITNCAELNWTRDNLSAYYILMNDIDLGACGVTGWNGGEGFIPIDRRVWDDGEEEWVITPFSGSFDGQNYTIGNLYINNVSMNYMGLFGYVQYSVIENLGLININITGGEPIGGLIGSNGGIVNNCNVAGSVNTTGTGGGGVVGENYGNFTDCHSMVIVNGGDQIGGFVGANSGIIINCSSTGSIIGTSNYFSGGFVGYNQYSELTETGEIYNSSATGNVTGDTYVGGFVGRGEGLIINCYATGNVTGDTDVGGFVGRLGYFSTDGTITNCYSIGNIIGDINVGGLIGTDDNGIITNCYWDNETSGQTTSDGGEGRTTAQMTYDYEGYDPPCIGLYEDWDLDTNTSGSSIWVHDDTSQNDGYPLFRWQYSGLPTIIMDINRTSFGFGIIQKDTVVYSNQTADTFRIYNNGTCDIDIDINGTNFTGDGVSDWVLSGTNGDNMIKMEIYNSTTDWFQINLTEDTWVTNMLAGTSMTANIGLTTPIIFYSGKPMSATVYMTASIH